MAASVAFLQQYAATLTLVRQQVTEGDGKGKGVVDVSVGSSRQKTVQGKWQAPPTGWIKVNVDGAFDHNSKRAGVGVVARDEFGKVVLSAWRVVFDAKSQEEIEMQACREGAILAAEWVRSKVIIKTDCTMVANMLCGIYIPGISYHSDILSNGPGSNKDKAHKDNYSDRDRILVRNHVVSD
ncbi:hypothetical protein PR202_gb23431 [Eleusine coracana subsp. coracana]|uniref:RNase H type-1 domain-containing protein n=1 Tax=Eleusine coracana subsp. coracana TaxID=191504 RepID=A0AAV5FK58_ELECO|nr:hypothetical protein PR202_gb23431 [Eleusine coracana subsp. coracana]